MPELADEAFAEGFEETYLTGGEPFLERDICSMIAYASDRLPTEAPSTGRERSTRRPR